MAPCNCPSSNTLDRPSLLHYIVIHRGDRTVAANALVQTRINGAVKAEASAVLATMGLTVK